VRIVGQPRVAEDTGATAELLDLCGHLPLALRIAGARLAAKPHWSVRRFVARLQPESRRLDELVHDGLSMRDRIACGYTALDRRSQEALRQLGARAAQTFTVPEVARLLDLAPRQAEDALERLVDHFLLDIAGIDADGNVRYRFPS
jgi:hypothetical protein